MKHRVSPININHNYIVTTTIDPNTYTYTYILVLLPNSAIYIFNILHIYIYPFLLLKFTMLILVTFPNSASYRYPMISPCWLTPCFAGRRCWSWPMRVLVPLVTASSGTWVDGEPRRRSNEESLVFYGDFMEVEWESMRVLG